MKSIRAFVEAAGLPRIIIAGFLLLLFALAPLAQISVARSVSDTLVRMAMNGVMVLALVPMVQSGCGLNFGLPLGIIAGLLGALLSIELNITGFAGLFFAMGVSLPFAAIFGYGYGLILNRVKGDEMMIATYVGFSSVSLMCIAWQLLPFTSPIMIWGYGGSGLRVTVSVSEHWLQVLSNFLSFQIGNFYFPTGMFLFLALMCFLVWAFFRTKLGTAITAVGSNPEFARASGIDVDKMRTVSVVLSTMLGAIGIVVYQQSFGFLQLYTGPFYMAFPAVAALLLGGASVNKATLLNVIVGTFLYQGICTMTPSVINSMLQTDMSELIRLIVSNGMILYALTRKVQVKR